MPTKRTYGAAPGYDLATGLGTPNAYNFVYSSVWGIRTPCPITFTNPGTQTYGVAPFDLTATDSPCNLPITFSVVSGPATVAGSTVTITGAGTVTLRASQPGDGTYLPDTEQVTFTVNQLNASVTPNPSSKVYGQSDPAFTGTLAGFLPADNVTATYSRTAGETVAGGPYTISATLSPSAACWATTTSPTTPRASRSPRRRRR